MRAEAEAVFVGGLLVGQYCLPRAGELDVKNPWLRDVLDAVSLVAEWTGSFPVDLLDVAATLRAVHGHEHPEGALTDLMLQFDRLYWRAQAFVPYLLLARELEAATGAQVVAEDTLHRALARHAEAKEKADAILRLFPVAA